MGKGEKLLRDWFADVWNKGDTSGMSNFISPNTKFHGLGDSKKVLKGPKGFLTFYNEMHSAFSNMKFKIVDSLESRGVVVIRWEATMKNIGKWMGAKPTGRTMKASGLVFARVKGSKIAESWNEWRVS